MLTECKDVIPAKERKQALFRKCVHVRGVRIQNFSAPNVDIFKGIFSGKVKFEAIRETKK